MPLYEYRCDQCQVETDAINKIDERRTNAPIHCEVQMTLLISAAFVSPDIEPYKAINSGEMITSRREHRYNLESNGLVEVGNDMPAWMKEKKYAEEHGAVNYRPPIPTEKVVDDDQCEFKYLDASELDDSSVHI